MNDMEEMYVLLDQKQTIEYTIMELEADIADSYAFIEDEKNEIARTLMNVKKLSDQLRQLQNTIDKKAGK